MGEVKQGIANTDPFAEAANQSLPDESWWYAPHLLTPHVLNLSLGRLNVIVVGCGSFLSSPVTVDEGTPRK